MVNPEENLPVTYDEFLAAVRCLASQLGQNKLIALLLERCIEMGVAIYAVIFSGAAYVPVELEHPAARKQVILEDSGVALLLTVESLRGSVPDEFANASGKRVMCVDGCHLQRQPLNPAAIASLPSRSGEDLLYIFYTSGTTGRPKGVMVAHEALCHRVGWLQSTFLLFP